jgi:Heterokaryon incompatibility protein (HET)
MASNQNSPTKALRLPEYTSLRYESLPKERGAFRILQLKASPVDCTHIECELITPKLGLATNHNSVNTNSKKNADKKKSVRERDSNEWKGEYEALSWCWGAEGETESITIRQDDKPYEKKVKPNLFSALKALRHHRHDRYLWCDAVCIDQGYAVEKNHQVEMMDEIYGNAKEVCIWLGDEDKSSKKALEFIDREVLLLKDFDALCDSPDAGEKWGALLDLMQRPWFSRRYVRPLFQRQIRDSSDLLGPSCHGILPW